jgi:2-enoate reductase
MGLARCALNAETMQSKKHYIKPADKIKNVAVIGGGIGGMESALVLAKRGHKVTLYEKSGELGGVFIAAAAPSFKEKDKDLLKYYETLVKKNNIDIRFNTEIKSLDEIEADEYVIATGSMGPNRLNLPGSERFLTAQEYIADGCSKGENVVIIGGGLTGSEMAYEVAKSGRKPAIVELQDDILIAPGSSMANTSFLRDAFEYYNVPVYTSAKTISADENSLNIIDESGNEVKLSADVIVQSIGFKRGLPFEVPEGADNVHVIGDSEKISNLLNAVHSAYKLAMTI